jgi:hypothetical protein
VPGSGGEVSEEDGGRDDGLLKKLRPRKRVDSHIGCAMRLYFESSLYLLLQGTILRVHRSHISPWARSAKFMVPPTIEAEAHNDQDPPTTGTLTE